MHAKQKKNENEEKAIEEEYNFDKPDFTFMAGENHRYVQKGPYLVCQSCPIEHAVFIGINNRMVGEKEGKPIIEKI